MQICLRFIIEDIKLSLVISHLINNGEKNILLRYKIPIALNNQDNKKCLVGSSIHLN